jgi:CDP-glycerol glycerophosphotransferase
VIAMGTISVVVPIYNVEPYLQPCLESIAGQTVRDLEVLMVDDGSTDGSAAIAEAFAAGDDRFRLITQPNGGLSRARNTGTDAATGEYLAFVDSDDMLPPNAYELLLGALQESGSDFATGNVHRLTLQGTHETPFLAKAFTKTRIKTHITKFRELLADRTAWNKLWRRSFWDGHELSFPEGRVHEDIPVTLPAHFMARSVDVISDPVYYYRIRESGELSITQRRLDERVLRDRVAAVEHVSAFLAREGPRNAKRWYDASVVAADLRYHLEVLEQADEHYREVFLDLANAFLDKAHRGVVRGRPAIERLEWHLVRRRMMPELLEVLRFQREDLRETPPLKIRGRWYGDYPFRTDRERKIPRSVYRLYAELTLEAAIEDLQLDGTRLQVKGYAFIQGIGAPTRDSQRVSIIALRPGRLRRVRVRATPVRARGTSSHRPDVGASLRQPLSDAAWSGFTATLDLRRLRRARRWHEGGWDLYLSVRAEGASRRRVRFVRTPARPPRAVEARPSDGVLLTAVPKHNGYITLEVLERWALLRGFRAADDALELTVELSSPPASELALEVVRRDGSAKRRYPLAVGEAARPAELTARVPLAALQGDAGGADVGDEEGEIEAEPPWDLHVVGDGPGVRLRFPIDVEPAIWPRGEGEVAFFRTRQGGASLAARTPRPIITEARWTADGALEVRGARAATSTADELVFRARDSLEQHSFPMRAGAGDGTFEAHLNPARTVSLAGELPLREGTWDLLARHSGSTDDTAMVPVMLSPALYPKLPDATVVAHKPFTLGMSEDGRFKLVVEKDLDDDERGAFNQRRLERRSSAARREPLRDTVVYSSFLGRQFSDSPRAIHEELVRRGAPLEHLWIVNDAQCVVPETATVLRDGSREFYEALASSRYVVYNDHFPDWFSRRPDQVCLQTWHGTPLKRLGFDASQTQRTIRKFERGWSDRIGNWQYVVSPNRFSTPILRRAYAIEGEMLETGYPRDDMLAGPDRAALTRRLRARLGLPQDARVVLYVPTYRDHVMDRRGRYRLDLRLDLARLREALGPDTVLLVRKHHYIVDAVPTTADGFVRDVSAFPDGTELMLAADVLVTDYSSMMFDFANTGRPMLFYTYDLDAYRDEIRGFYFDFTEAAPGPLLRTADELIEALDDLEAVKSEYAQRYAAFVAKFCELDDGHASARVVDRLFSS